MITMNEKFYKPSEIANKLEVSRAKIYKDIADGKLECVKVGGVIRITHAQVMKYLNGGTSESQISTTLFESDAYLTHGVF